MNEKYLKTLVMPPTHVSRAHLSTKIKRKFVKFLVPFRCPRTYLYRQFALPSLVYCGTVLLFLSKENIFQESLFDHKLLRGWDGMGDSGDNWITHVYKRRISIMYSPSRIEIDLGSVGFTSRERVYTCNTISYKK